MSDVNVTPQANLVATLERIVRVWVAGMAWRLNGHAMAASMRGDVVLSIDWAPWVGRA